MFQRLKKYLRESWGELKKLNYPKREEVINATVVIIAFSIAMAIFLGAVDAVSNATTKWIVGTADWAMGGDRPTFDLLKVFGAGKD